MTSDRKIICIILFSCAGNLHKDDYRCTLSVKLLTPCTLILYFYLLKNNMILLRILQVDVIFQSININIEVVAWI